MLYLELEEQWRKDRAKKAERKRQRRLERLAKAADPFTPKSGGKKGRKAMLAAARLHQSIVQNRIVNMPALVTQIRVFVVNPGENEAMVLPPMSSPNRKMVHELAFAFGLKSKSRGSGEGRYSSLTRTKKTGLAVDERLIARILRRGERIGFGDSGGSEHAKEKYGLPRNRDGDEVGKVCAVPHHLNFTLNTDPHTTRLLRKLGNRILGSKYLHLWDGRRATELESVVG